MQVNLNKINTENLGFFRFKKLNGKYLLTNEIGDFIFLNKENFKRLLEGNLNRDNSVYQKLVNKNFIRNRLNKFDLIERYRTRNRFIWQGPTLHIIVVTLRCDHKCIYCQSSSRSIYSEGFDMDRPTANKIVDIIFESPSRFFTIEFQGGEPLLNFRIIKYIVGYIFKKNKKLNKYLHLTLVSNFTYLDDDILDFLIKNNIYICTSLDGPGFIHNKQRKYLKGNSYKNTIFWLKKLKKIYKKMNPSMQPSALPTITKYSLGFPKEIVDEYWKLGFSSIHLRPVMSIGLGRKTWEEVGYSYEDFLNFYIKALDYIIELNLKGIFFFERMARYLLMKIIACKEPNYLDLRSPCGAGIGQLVYNFNGKVYTCDEGRMVAQMGDDTFYLGDVRKNNLKDFFEKDIIKGMCLASCLDSLPLCEQCVYKPYCGVCPVYNYLEEGNIFRNNNERCKIHSGMLDYLFNKLQNKRIKKEVFLKWIPSQSQ